MSLTFTQMRKSFGVALSLAAGLGVNAQNLIINPSAESAVTTGWQVMESIGACTSGTAWRMQSGQSGFPNAQHGSYFFQTGCGGTIGNTYELRQNINMSSYAGLIDGNALRVVFSGYMQSYNQNPADETRIVVEFRNASGTVLGSYDTGVRSIVSVWTRYTDTRRAPIGTRTIRIRLLGTARNGNATDSYFDNLSLTVASTLPVTMQSFEATSQAGDVKLAWITSSETNNKGFSVQRSQNGQDWHTIGFVAAQEGNSGDKKYEYTDKQALTGTNYYRLQQEDFDGTISYSLIRTVQINANGKSFIYPNPVKETLNFTTDMVNPKVKVINAEGRVLINHTGTQRQVKTNTLVAGVYFLLLEDASGRKEVLKFMKH